VVKGRLGKPRGVGPSPRLGQLCASGERASAFRHGPRLPPPHHQTQPSHTGKERTPSFLDLGILHWGSTSAAQPINISTSRAHGKIQKNPQGGTGGEQKLASQPHHSPDVEPCVGHLCIAGLGLWPLGNPKHPYFEG